MIEDVTVGTAWVLLDMHSGRKLTRLTQSFVKPRYALHDNDQSRMRSQTKKTYLKSVHPYGHRKDAFNDRPRVSLSTPFGV